MEPLEKGSIISRFGVAIGLSVALNAFFLFAVVRFSIAHQGHQDAHLRAA